MRPRLRYVLVVLMIASDAASVAAQASDCLLDSIPTLDLADVWSIRLRAAQLEDGGPAGSLTIRRPSHERKISRCEAAADTVSPHAVQLLPARLRALVNTAYPLDINTGTLWAGKGLSSSAEVGAVVRFGPVTLTAYPIVTYQQNVYFRTRVVEHSGASPFAYAGHANIDWPQRHGDAHFWALAPGQTSVQVAYRGFAAGVSTENMWIGPAQRMPLMMGSTAPGFPHVFLGTRRPVDIWVGGLEAQFFWGRLEESDYFDGEGPNDENLLVGATLTLEPAVARGLYLGVHRSSVRPYDQPEWSVFDYLYRPFTGITENPPEDNQLFSIFGRWVHPEAGFEAYAEWARDDHWDGLNDLLGEPDHSQAYMLGFQKLVRLRGARLRWWGELAHLEHSLTLRSGRGAVTFYTHSVLQQGYTHRGQLLGAWIGPGSDSQILGVDRIAGRRMTGIALERVRFDADAYYNRWAPIYGYKGHDMAFAFWARHSDTIGEQFRISATAAVARRQNRNGVYFDGEHPADYRWETNGQVDLELRWLPPMPRE